MKPFLNGTSKICVKISKYVINLRTVYVINRRRETLTKLYNATFS